MTQWQAPALEEMVYVIGDIHGCVDKLSQLLTKIDDDISAHPGVRAKIVFVGDYIDRGEDSATVLNFMADITRADPERVIALMGNHERMLLDFLADPTGSAKRWIRHGGLQTLASFGVGAGLTTESRNAGDLLDAAGDLMEMMGGDLVEWIHSLPLTWRSGSLWVVHAGADPSVAMDAQSKKVLLWGSDAFLQKKRSDGQWVVFGHQPFEEPLVDAGRIGIDTGAVYGGNLTAARFTPDGDISFLTS